MAQHAADLDVVGRGANAPGHSYRVGGVPSASEHEAPRRGSKAAQGSSAVSPSPASAQVLEPPHARLRDGSTPRSAGFGRSLAGSAPRRVVAVGVEVARTSSSWEQITSTSPCGARAGARDPPCRTQASGGAELAVELGEHQYRSSTRVEQARTPLGCFKPRNLHGLDAGMSRSPPFWTAPGVKRAAHISYHPVR